MSVLVMTYNRLDSTTQHFYLILSSIIYKIYIHVDAGYAGFAKSAGSKPELLVD